MPNLRTLLLSSNALSGSIDGSVALSSSIIELDLSHNRLTGTIPLNIQNHTWSLLDLFNNKLSGVLHRELFQLNNRTGQAVYPTSSGSGSIYFDQSLYLTSNRLSGQVPHSISNAISLSVLSGNLFNCKFDKSDLPQRDHGIDNYQCASNNFYISLILWVGLLFCIFVGCLLWWNVDWKHLLFSTSNVRALLSARGLRNLTSELDVFAAVKICGWWCALFCTVVLLPYYAVASQYYGTHTYQYAYVVSAVYTSSIVSFAITTVLLALLLTLFYYLLRWSSVTASAEKTTVVDNASVWAQRYVYITFALCNTAAVVSVNICYVYIMLYQISQVQTIAQIALSLFKLFWSMSASPYMMRKAEQYFMPEKRIDPGAYFALQLVVALFNNVAIPCLVVAAIHTNCFRYIILPPQRESVTYLQTQCNSEAYNSCAEITYPVATLTFEPPFTYSYQCSASVITAYAPAFMYMAISSAFLHPAVQYAAYQLHQRKAVSGVYFRIAEWILPRMLKSPTELPPVDKVSANQPIFGAAAVLVTLLTQLGILLTFGAIFPPIALAMAVSITAIVYFTHFKVRCFVTAVVDTQLVGWLEVVDSECASVGTREHNAATARTIVWYCSAFYALFLFDNLGDQMGAKDSAWVLLVFPTAPVVIFGIVDVYKWYVHKLYSYGGDNKVINEVGRIEMAKLDAVGSQIEKEYVENNCPATVNIIHTSSV